MTLRRLFLRGSSIKLLALLVSVGIHPLVAEDSSPSGAELGPPPPGYQSMAAIQLAVLSGRLKLVDRKRKASDTIRVEKGVVYGQAGEKKLKLDLYAPKTIAKPTAGLIFIHGGGWKSGKRSDYHFYCVKFAEAGYVVATITYRLAPKQPFPAAIEDVKCAVRWMRKNAKKLGVDPNRLVAIGGSAGGHLAMLAGYSSDVAELEGKGGHANVSSRVQAVVNLYGPTDLRGEKARNDKTVHGLFGGKSLEEAKRAYELASPIYHLSKDDPPTLIIHGTIDDIVPVAHADRLAKELAKLGISHRYDRLEGWPHTLDLARVTNERCRKLMLAFFAKHVPPNESR